MGSVADYRASVYLIRKTGETELLADVSNDIYYYENNYHNEDYDEEDIEDGDEDEDQGSNETSDTFVITQKFIDSLKPGDIIELNGDGSCW